MAVSEVQDGAIGVLAILSTLKVFSTSSIVRVGGRAEECKVGGDGV